ncbi:endonuclease/exonuclease/phosphatase family protein [Brevifollis gellanilyticus]|nr:endonuclease/exonuclease/phosphatase family protein [Brevifollis gellanilyticus]
MTQSRPFVSASVRLDGILDVLILLALSGSWLGVFGHWHWALDVFAHFRWQYLIFCWIAVGWSLWRRRKYVAWISGATLALNAAMIGSLLFTLPSPTGTEVPDFKLRVVSLNVLTENRRHQDVLDFLRKADADVIFLMEIDHVWAEAMKPLEQSHPHHQVYPREDNFGVAFYSRLPLKDVHVTHRFEHGLNLDSDPPPTIEARLSIGARELVMYGVHTLPPGGAMQWRSRNFLLEDIGLQAAALKEPVLVFGDLNATPWCEGMRCLLRAGRLGFHMTTPPWAPTWRVTSPFAIPIDHALCTPPLAIQRREISGNLGSDHRAQILDIRWMDGAACCEVGAGGH